MTISSEVRKAGPFAGNDVTTSFPFTFRVFAQSDLVVVYTDGDGIETTLELDTDYTVTLNSNQDASPGGTVTLPEALATGDKLTLTSEVQALQLLDLTNQGGFYPAVINRALDRMTVVMQQLKEQVGRAWKIPISNPDVTADELMAEMLQAAQTAVEAADRVDLGFLDEAVAAAGDVATQAAEVSAALGLVDGILEMPSDAMTALHSLGSVESKLLAKSDANNWYLLMPKAGTRATGLLYQISQGSAVGDAGAGSVGGGNYNLFRVAKVVETLRAVGCLHTASATSGTWTGPTSYSIPGQASGFGVGAWTAIKLYQTTIVNSYKEYAVSVGAGGKFSVGFVVGVGFATAVKVSIDGVDIDTFSTVATATNIWVKEYQASPGAHTVRITKTDAAASPMQLFGCNFYDASDFPVGNNLDSIGYARTANFYKNASTGAIEYAIQAIGTDKFAGSFHGGETRSVLKLLVDGVDVSGASVGATYSGRDIKIIQETSVDTLAGSVAINSTTQFLRSGGHVFSAVADAGVVPIRYFYTHMDVLEAGFNRLIYPKVIDFTGYANNSQVEIGQTEVTVLENPSTGQRAMTWSPQFPIGKNAYDGARVWVSSGVYNKPYNGPVVDYPSGAVVGKINWSSLHAYF